MLNANRQTSYLDSTPFFTEIHVTWIVMKEIVVGLELIQVTCDSANSRLLECRLKDDEENRLSFHLFDNSVSLIKYNQRLFTPLLARRSSV